MKSAFLALLAGAVCFTCASPLSAAETSKTRQGTVYSFCSKADCADGANPVAGPIDMDGTLYGTTTSGGTIDAGAIYALDPKSGAERVVYSFCSQQRCADGYSPRGSLTPLNGLLYGTTFWGGASMQDGGTVFSVDPNTGAYAVRYVFCGQLNCTDGDGPAAGMIELGGKLYGTTQYGGAHSNGAVFAVDPGTGAEEIVYSFCSQQGCADGASPQAALIAVKGTLYGTTYSGGAHGSGIVFALDPNTGAEQVLYSFCSQQSCADGQYSLSGLTYAKGKLYGTTFYGGSNCSVYCGTVFSLDTKSGAESTLYSFCAQQNCTDGGGPSGALVCVKGMLYGTTGGGGAYNVGTVFSLDVTSGAETVLHSFGSGQDGMRPLAGAVRVKGTLYVTTDEGGAGGQGTVFALKKQ